MFLPQCSAIKLFCSRHGATKQLSARTTTQRMPGATSVRHHPKHYKDQRILTPDTGARFVAESSYRRATWVNIWKLFIALMAPDTSARFAAGSLHRRAAWVCIEKLFIVQILLVAQVTSVRYAARSTQRRAPWVNGQMRHALLYWSAAYSHAPFLPGAALANDYFLPKFAQENCLQSPYFSPFVAYCRCRKTLRSRCKYPWVVSKIESRRQ